MPWLKTKKPKIILWDIEITWNGFGRNTSAMLCMAWKELGKKAVHCLSQWDYEDWEKDLYDDYDLVKEASTIFEDADAMVTHYGSKFDLTFFNTALIANGFPPLAKIPHLDTWRVAKNNLRLTSNRLDEVARTFGLERKSRVGLETWQKVVNRDMTACKKMTKYCKQDVVVLEEVFLALRPFMSSIPNYNLFTENKDIRVCPFCGSHRVYGNGVKVTKTRRYRRYRCNDCGSYSRAQKVDDEGLLLP